MRIKDKGTRWNPNISPTKPEDLPQYLFNELTKLSRTLFQVGGLHMDRQYKLPDRPRDGDFALFDDDVVDAEGGLHYYNGTEWKKLMENV